jgi:hypothetical protein
MPITRKKRCCAASNTARSFTTNAAPVPPDHVRRNVATMIAALTMGLRVKKKPSAKSPPPRR